jgi:hypothetical protein
MKRQEGEASGEVGMELKYCEHCGGLWVRERGTGTVYCDRCQAKVADLPAAKKGSGRLILPVGPHAEVDDCKMDVEVEDGADMEAMGGVA